MPNMKNSKHGLVYMKELPKNGSRWQGSNREIFRVQHVVELDKNTWVHYIKDDGTNEYSCYLESFLSRFVALPE